MIGNIPPANKDKNLLCPIISPDSTPKYETIGSTNSTQSLNDFESTSIY